MPMIQNDCPPDGWDSDIKQPCMACGGPNDVGELCLDCAKTNDPCASDLEASGGWMVQDGHGRPD